MLKSTLNILQTSFVAIILIVTTPSISAQKVSFAPPLRLELLLSGNYGELRADHFHSGVDFRTLGSIGHPIYAPADGYVSRIKIQSGGYGNAIYINHRNGYTTVYGHLDKYSEKIATYVKDLQYALETFEIDNFPDSSKFTFTKGQIIGFSGNTGRSGGPHLHYEIRETDSQTTLNALKFKLPIKDTIAPSFFALYLYEISDNNFNIITNKKPLPVYLKRNNHFSANNIISSSSKIAFGAEVYDFLNGTPNKCGISSAKLFFDDSLIFSFEIDKISFEKTRYINSHMDYEEKLVSGKCVHKFIVEPNNLLPIYKNGKGFITLEDTLLHAVRIEVTDIYKNFSSLNFNIKGTTKDSTLSNFVDLDISKSKPIFKYNENNYITNESYSIKIPPYALYNDIFFDIQVIPDTSASLQSDIYEFGSAYTPLHKSATISIKPKTNIDTNLLSKYSIVKINGNGNSRTINSKWEKGQLEADISTLGSFAVDIDTTAPEISPVKFNNKAKYFSGNSISFTIKDTQSDIKSYSGFIDDKWVLFEYDAKNNLIEYKIDPKKISPDKLHQLKIIVVDSKNNTAQYFGEFHY